MKLYGQVSIYPKDLGTNLWSSCSGDAFCALRKDGGTIVDTVSSLGRCGDFGSTPLF